MAMVTRVFTKILCKNSEEEHEKNISIKFSQSWFHYKHKCIFLNSLLHNYILIFTLERKKL